MNQDLIPVNQFDANEIEVIKQTIAPDLTDTELKLFVSTCKRTGLDPFSRQIYVTVKSWTDKRGQAQRKVSIQATVDGFRVIAERSGKYEGQEGPFWCSDDGVWKDVWLGKGSPMACKVGVNRSDFKGPLWAVARTDAYFQASSPVWDKMPEQMVAKCAESLALRKAFPNDLSGIYSAEEMAQAEHLPEPRHSHPAPAQLKARPKAEPVVVMPKTTHLEPVATPKRVMDVAPPSGNNGVADWPDEPAPSAYEELGFLKEPDVPVDPDDPLTALETYKIDFGKYKDRTLLQIGLKNSRDYAKWMKANPDPNRPVSERALKFFEMVNLYELYTTSEQNKDSVPF